VEFIFNYMNLLIITAPSEAWHVACFLVLPEALVGRFGRQEEARFAMKRSRSSRPGAETGGGDGGAHPAAGPFEPAPRPRRRSVTTTWHRAHLLRLARRRRRILEGPWADRVLGPEATLPPDDREEDR
jgi:hypothetical protein